MDSIDVDILTPKSPEGDLFRFAGTFYSRREITPPLGDRGVPVINPEIDQRIISFWVCLCLLAVTV